MLTAGASNDEIAVSMRIKVKTVEGMLRRIGFDYAGQIDPFDGGPHFSAKTDDITVVRSAREAVIRTVGHGDGDVERPWAVLAVQTAGMRPQFRAIAARVVPMEAGVVGIADEARQRLAVENGHKVWLSYG